MTKHKHSNIIVFALLAFLFSYGLSFGFQWVVAVHRLPIADAAADLLAKGLAVSGPALAGLTLTWIARKSVWRWLKEDLSETRFALWWLGIPIFTMTITLLAFSLAGARASAFPALLGQLPTLLSLFVFHVLVVGLLEELGWRGWLLRRLLLVRTPLVATLIIAPVWFAWHLPKLLSDGSFAAAFALGAIVNSTILTALWSRFSGRTALAALAHGSFNAPIYFMADQFPEADAVFAFSIVVSSYGLVALAIIASNWRWWLRRPAGEKITKTSRVIAASG
ncbi:MAG: CPBP family intramembrane metalloprotease [Erythrobacter sp.]|nr:MAG: CPBP family intramembrane metalloprotease [Erythrobacter sp.]